MTSFFPIGKSFRVKISDINVNFEGSPFLQSFELDVHSYEEIFPEILRRIGFALEYSLSVSEAPEQADKK